MKLDLLENNTEWDEEPEITIEAAEIIIKMLKKLEKQRLILRL